MSIRQMYGGSIVKPGLNTLASPAAIVTYQGLWTWGRNNNGQLGLGNITNYSSPKQVGALTTWLRTAGGNNHTTAISGTTTYPYTQYAGIWNINSQGNAKAAGTWP